MAKKVDHTHGDTGIKPSDSLNFQRGDKPDPEVFDWFWSEVPAAINDHANTLESIDSDGDGIVDKADEVVNGYTDSDAVSAVDGEVDNAATTVAGLDDTVAGKSDEGHDHTGTDEVQIPDSGLVENYVTSTESSSYTDANAIDAVDGEVDNAATTVAGLDDAVAGKAEDTEVSSIQSSSDVDHDSTTGGTDADAHHTRYSDNEAVSAVDGEVDNAATTVAGLDDTVAGKASDSHNNNQHSTNYLKQSQYTPSDDITLDGNTSVSGELDMKDNYIDDINQLVFAESDDGYVVTPNEWVIGTSGTATTLEFVYDEQRSNPALQLQGSDAAVAGDMSVSGNKPFVIPHPTENDKTLRHCAYEGPVSGGLIYRDQVEVVNGTADMDLPDYVLNGEFGADWIQSVTPKEHFGTGYLDTDTWTVNADSDGTYDVILMGQRTDDNGLAGMGGITTKNEDEDWDEAADRFYGGADDIDGNEVATDDDEYRQTTLYAHAESQYEDEQ